MADDNSQQSGQRGISPAFILVNDIKRIKEDFSLYDMCMSISGVVDQDNLEGCQQVRGLWKIYVKTIGAKMDLVSQGITVHGVSITVHDTNPFIQQGYAQRMEDRNVSQCERFTNVPFK